MLSVLPFALVNGLEMAMTTFLVAAGLTLIFGVLKILNFAHGAFFMIAAYVAFSASNWFGGDPTLFTFLCAALVSAVVIAILGLIADFAVLRRLRGMDEGAVLIATFALLLICQGGVKLVWGVDQFATNPPDELAGMVTVAGVALPKFSLAVIALGIASFVGLDIVIHRSWAGKVIQGVAHDRWIMELFGVNVSLVNTAVVVAAFAMVGLAGGLLLPNQGLSLELGDTYVLLSFVILIIGGLGSVRGAFVAAVLLGLIDSLTFLFLPSLQSFSQYAAIVAFLIFRPQGLFGARNAT
jgi:branched-chain amino acid transport system permease protein